MIFLQVAIGLTIANFIWQLLNGHKDWMEACERSFFQCIAVLLCWLGNGRS